MKHIPSKIFNSFDETQINPHVLKHEDDILFLRDHYFENNQKMINLDKEDPEYKELKNENKWIVSRADKILQEFIK